MVLSWYVIITILFVMAVAMYTDLRRRLIYDWLATDILPPRSAYRWSWGFFLSGLISKRKTDIYHLIGK